MKIIINTHEIEIFRGAKIESAVRKFDKKILKEIKNGTAEIFDKYGNRLSLSSPLHENSQITISKISQQ
jgi:hypothetical protein